MKKAKIPFLFALLFCAGISNAQIFKLDGLYLSGGYGFGAATIESNRSLNNPNLQLNSYQNFSVGPFALQAEYGISNRLGIAFHFTNMHSYANGTYTENVWDPNTNSFKTEIASFDNAKHVTGMSVRINNHFSKSDKLDVYWGVGLGQNKVRYKISTTGSHSTVNTLDDVPIFAELYVGGRTYFNDHWGAYAEVGFMKTFVIAGLTWRRNK